MHVLALRRRYCAGNRYRSHPLVEAMTRTSLLSSPTSLLEFTEHAFFRILVPPDASLGKLPATPPGPTAEKDIPLPRTSTIPTLARKPEASMKSVMESSCGSLCDRFSHIRRRVTMPRSREGRVGSGKRQGNPGVQRARGNTDDMVELDPDADAITHAVGEVARHQRQQCRAAPAGPA